MFRLGIGKWAILFCLSFSTPFSFSGGIYRWTDETGVVHFTDDISNVPVRYRGEVDKREATEKISDEAENQIDSGCRPRETTPPVKEGEKPDRVRKYLEAIDERIEERKTIEKKISELEEEMKRAEERIKQLERDEEENYPLMQPFRNRSHRRFVPVESPHYREKVDLADRIKSIKGEIATLEKRLSEIKRSL